MNRKQNLREFIANSSKSNEVYSCHVTELREFTHHRGFEILKESLKILIDASEVITELNLEPKFPVIYLPIGTGSSAKIKFWKEKYFGEIGYSDEPGSIYILGINNIFEEFDEEYKYPIVNSPLNNEKVIMVYRCFRSREFVINNWKEFSTGIYVVLRDSLSKSNF